MKSYQKLCDRLGILDSIPYTKDWSAAADFLEIIVNHVLTKKPNVILECSSGLTTLMLARCCELNQKGTVMSLENGAEYIENTQKYIKQYALEDYATLIHAPLEKTKLEHQEYLWYQVTDKIPENIDMLIIDGPNGYIQKNSRYPALPKLYSLFSKKCTVFLDDAARNDEMEIVSLWNQDYPSLEFEYIENERGCVILNYEK